VIPPSPTQVQGLGKVSHRPATLSDQRGIPRDEARLSGIAKGCNACVARKEQRRFAPEEAQDIDGCEGRPNLEVRAMRDRDRTTLDYVRPGAEQRGRLREDFDFNDLNRDGRLSLGEFIRFMGTVDEDITPEELQIGFDEIDTNRDGSIDFEEFAAWWNERA
jgi:calmodulin